MSFLRTSEILTKSQETGNFWSLDFKVFVQRTGLTPRRQG